MPNSKSVKGLKRRCISTAQILKSLSHPHRLEILCHLIKEEKTVGALAELCGVSQSLVSQFLARMKREGIVSSRKDGQFVKVKIADSRILRTIQSLQRIYCED